MPFSQKFDAVTIGRHFVDQYEIVRLKWLGSTVHAVFLVVILCKFVGFVCCNIGFRYFRLRFTQFLCGFGVEGLTSSSLFAATSLIRFFSGIRESEFLIFPSVLNFCLRGVRLLDVKNCVLESFPTSCLLVPLMTTSTPMTVLREQRVHYFHHIQQVPL